MNIITMKSEQRISPFAPEWQWVMGEDFLENIDWNEVATIILEKEKVGDFITTHILMNIF